jgi:hypothetical protein
MNQTITRLGGGAAVLGAAIALVFNLLHPRSYDIASAAATAHLAGQEGIWRIDHYMLAISGLLLLCALTVIATSFTEQPAASWARIALPFGIASSGIFLVWATLDGFALPEAAASGPVVAEAVAHIVRGMFVTMVASVFGVTPILFGVAMLSGRDDPRWLGSLAIVAGSLGLVTTTMTFLAGFTILTYDILFTSSSLLFTVWVGSTGVTLWRRAAQPRTHPDLSDAHAGTAAGP